MSKPLYFTPSLLNGFPTRAEADLMLDLVSRTSSSYFHGYVSFGFGGSFGSGSLNMLNTSASPSALSTAPSGQIFLQCDGLFYISASLSIPLTPSLDNWWL